MKVDVTFKNARVYDISKFDVLKGEGFKFTSDAPTGVRWFSDNDPALSLSADGSGASADATGESTILVMDSNYNVLKEIKVRVIDDLATTLGLKAGEPEVK